MKKVFFILITASIFLMGCSTSQLEVFNDELNYTYEVVYEKLNNPWGLEFISENQILITEKQGDLIYLNLENFHKVKLSGLPQISNIGQGGLLDVHFNEGYVYLTYSASNDQGYATHLGKAILDLEKLALKEFEVIHIATPFMQGGAHFGSRVITQGEYVYYSTGDRGQKNFGPQHVSQDTQNYLGTIIRLYKNGTVPLDNPFIDDESVLDEIYTYGHRNVQGLALNPVTNELWASEHGERDGDKINIIRSGSNYGWPIAHSGCRYGTSTPVAESEFENEDVENPVYVWECGTGGFPPAGMIFYQGERLEKFNGDLFVGNLAGQYLGRFIIQEDGEVKQAEPLLKNLGERIRDVSQSPDDYLYVITDSGKLIKIS
ncbi:MAG: PQQ-dependent sugar dehydrogenase [Candidatus Woesearchaeota archaeon]